MTGARFIPAPAGNARPRSMRRPGTAVHPRASGERLLLVGGAVLLAGSSPRQRGTRSCGNGAVPSSRFIPAPAGNAARTLRRLSDIPVHPRASGERLIRLRGSLGLSGSSPRQRGTRLRPAPLLGAGRFIPAPAGNAATRWCSSDPCPVHPRASGERYDETSLPLLFTGSSPRQRGTRAPCRAGRRRRRFIPAPAGNAGCSARWSASRTVHPRASGERDESEGAYATRGGSSPRQRGTLQPGLAGGRCDRFIPAPAGNAGASPGAPIGLPVHPRASGERADKRARDAVIGGSSPRQRGTPFRRVFHFSLRRFIPAPAGNALTRHGLPFGHPVHPRASGERNVPAASLPAVTGSSPRQRGTPPDEYEALSRIRFIPAPAGNAS